jgi:hypothetical protein
VKTAAQWKAFYAEERRALGEVGLRERLEAAADVELPEGGALVFPHTMMARTGDLTAAVARAVVRSGADEVLAIGVLHGGRGADAERIRRARAGDEGERALLRGVHAGTEPLCAEEFSLDSFAAMLRLAASLEGKNPPRVVARFPFLVGHAVDLPGMEELATLAARMPVVATTDPLHHGAGYGTPEGSRLSEHDRATHAWAQACIERQLALLASHDWPGFARLAEDVRSDFRDAGPALFSVLGGRARMKGAILDLRLVDYAEVLGAEHPSWVAGPLMRVGPA